MRAAPFSLLGANQRLPYHSRSCARTSVLGTAAGSRLSGVMRSRRSSAGTIEGEPQKSQRWAARWESNTLMA
ncbi:MAG: hypothetical protein MUC40_09870 [Akkermansiaceae bacterium]|nr:hypothetical protein [Akkermansiaceae bacterium]